ncbi:hypothetical protein Tco_0347941 [Tanacetum coccineum]
MQSGVSCSTDSVLDEVSIRCNLECNKAKSGMKQTDQTYANRADLVKHSRFRETDAAIYIRFRQRKQIQAERGDADSSRQM